MRTSLRLIARRLAAGALLLAAISGSIAAGVWAPPAAAATPTCTTSQLVVWLDTNSNGAAGTIYYTLNFTNIATTCTLRGYPGVSAVSQTGHQLGSAATRQNIAKVRAITLQGTGGGDPTPASTAQATVGITHAAFFSATACHGVTASGLRVYVPNQSSASFVAFPFAACTSRGPDILRISAVRR